MFLLIRSAFLILCFAFLPFFMGCSDAEKMDLDSPAGAYSRAQTLEKDERFEEALAHYREIKNKHPYSRFATLAELRVAEINFKRESYVEAESGYRLFKEFHPDFPKIDYITFRLGLSYFKQIPDTIDRDLSLASSAIIYFDELIKSYPKSDYLQSAKEHKLKCLTMLAQKEAYIAHFYFIREKFASALGRYQNIINNYPGLITQKKALYGATLSAYRIKKFELSRKYFLSLKQTFPASKEVSIAEKELSNGSI